MWIILNPPDFKPSFTADYLSKFPPSFAVGLVQHLAELLHHRLLQRVDLRGAVQRLRHGQKQPEPLSTRFYPSGNTSAAAARSSPQDNNKKKKCLLPGKTDKSDTDTPTALSWVFRCQRVRVRQDEALRGNLRGNQRHLSAGVVQSVEKMASEKYMYLSDIHSAEVRQ